MAILSFNLRTQVLKSKICGRHIKYHNEVEGEDEDGGDGDLQAQRSSISCWSWTQDTTTPALDNCYDDYLADEDDDEDAQVEVGGSKGGVEEEKSWKSPGVPVTNCDHLVFDWI